MLYDVFDHRGREVGFRWLHEDEITAAATPARVRRGRTANKAEQIRWTCKPLEPRAAFFHAHIERSKLDCHPDRVPILLPNTGGN